MSILENIRCHNDLLKLDSQERTQLCQEIRDFLVSYVSKTGGHLASNLGVVELTVALETVFDTTKDRLVFDVGHQSYIHKLLTGRQTGFHALRQFGGMAGFPKPSESESDAFVAGHASSSISIALGMARARTLSKENYNVIALLGDGAATGGMVFEGLNDAAVSNEPMIVVLNDNQMSIDHNVGGLASHLSQLRTKEKYLGIKRRSREFLSKTALGSWALKCLRHIKDAIRRLLIPTTIFESVGFTYLGPVDGHDIENLIHLLQVAKDMKRPVLLHVITRKGKGYTPAEEHPKLFHGVGKFDPITGEVISKGTQTFSESFGAEICALAQENPKVCAITAAMPGGTGLLTFKSQFPKRMFDVGIAEEHAISMAGGLAKQGMVPVVALYSTFLQRGFDMILQDVCLLGLHVVFAIDRAGLVGEDGETHHGVFDVGFLRQAPGMRILCPASMAEQRDMLRWAVTEYDGPVAVRYPRGSDREITTSCWDGNQQIAIHGEGTDVTLISYGPFTQNLIQAKELLEEQGIHAKVLRLLSVSPLPVEQLCGLLDVNTPVVILEEASGNSGIKEHLAWQLREKMPDLRVYGKDLGYQYITHGALDQLYQHCGLDSKSICEFIQEVLKVEN